MIRTPMDRREFLMGCCATAAAGAAGPGLFFAGPAKAAANSYDTFVLVFLRGGMDGLNLVVPTSGADRAWYERARPDLNIRATGDYAALPLTLASGAATGFGLHPAATGLSEVWSLGKLAIVQACGMPTAATRSHFDAQLFLDLGTPGQHGTGTGWLTRAWDTHPANTGGTPMPALAVASRQPANLLGSTPALAMESPGDFELNAGAWAWQQYREGMPAGTRGVNETIASLWAGRTGLERRGQRADASLRLIAQQPYSDPPAGWPDSRFARQLWTVAQSIRFNLGLRFATVDLGGWDTHEGQGTAGGGYHYYQNMVTELSEGLSAFYTELAAGGEIARVTVAVQSEFGRRVQQNASGGTDHGYGNPMLLLGGAVNGRELYGNWPGLDPDVLSAYFGDLPATTDFRQVFSEIMIRRMGNNRLSDVFPGYSGYSPLGVVQGTDQAPQVADAGAATPTVPRRTLATHPRPAALRPTPFPGGITPRLWWNLLRRLGWLR